MCRDEDAFWTKAVVQLGFLHVELQSSCSKSSCCSSLIYLAIL